MIISFYAAARDDAATLILITIYLDQADKLYVTSTCAVFLHFLRTGSIARCFWWPENAIVILGCWFGRWILSALKTRRKIANSRTRRGNGYPIWIWRVRAFQRGETPELALFQMGTAAMTRTTSSRQIHKVSTDAVPDCKCC